MPDRSDTLPALESRTGLPPALRVLVEEIPRLEWKGHPNFGGMVQFWLERHLMFRSLMTQLSSDAEELVDRKIDLEAYAPRLSRYGGFFLNQLHGHHQIEDAHYFPRLAGLDPRITRGFEILDADHHALDGHLNDFATGANAVLQKVGQATAGREAAGAFHGLLGQFDGFLNRHLTDEEELVVPVILKTGFDGH
jgi:iron-sulfur cluster repair protein YtfE (RIC family)